VSAEQFEGLNREMLAAAHKQVFGPAREVGAARIRQSPPLLAPNTADGAP
jgi:hypothetical protein